MKNFRFISRAFKTSARGKRSEPKRAGRRNSRVGVSALAALCAAVVLGSVAMPLAHARMQSGTPESGVSVESSQQLFAVMCALDAAGFASDESTLAEMPSRLALRGDLLKLQGPSVDALRQFYREHQLADSGETLSRFLTFALVVGEPPRFQFVVDRDVLPPDALAIEGFQEVLANFYHDAHLDLRWAAVQPEYERAIAKDQSPVRHIVFTANAYLREIYQPKFGHTFTVFVEPLVGNRTNFRNTGDHYSVVVGAGTEFPYDDVQHAYLHFMLDPLPLKFRKEVTAKAGLLNIGAKSPRLPAEYRSDFLAYADESLIKAVELRLKHLPADKMEAQLSQDDQDGFTMVRPLVAQLMKFEKEGPSMSLYFPDLINGINVEAEQKRLANFVFSPDAAKPTAAKAQPAMPEATTELDRMLAQGERQIATGDPTGATVTFEKILEQHPTDSRAMYGLAVASLLNQDGDRAQQLFEKLVEAPGPATAADASNSQATESHMVAPDPSILAWSHVYLGRMHDVSDERDQAVVQYRAALAVPGAPEAARVAAQRGVDAPYSTQGGAGAPPKGSQNQ